ncbi:MAG: WG repeat-containing protein, partial [Paramuribaculum sp.]|nr:WG repeat-containing protein [Paramuribaculum sp.]
DYIRVKKGGMWGIMSIDGKEIIPTEYHFIKFGDTNLAIVGRNNNFGLFDLLTHTEIIPPSFEGLEIIDTNLVKYKLNDFWGVMNPNGKEIIPTTRGYTKIDYIKGLKKFTYSMHGFKGECNSLGAQLSKIAVPVNDSSLKNNSSGTLSASTTNEKSDKKSSNDNQVRAYTETVPVQVWQPCGGCNGSGQCGVCFGSGWTLSYNGGKRTCIACHGNGKCTSCAGHGGQNVVRYETRTVYR